jgi:hypothetical protein
MFGLRRDSLYIDHPGPIQNHHCNNFFSSVHNSVRFPLQVRNKPHVRIYKCAFILDLGVVTNSTSHMQKCHRSIRIIYSRPFLF